MPSSTARRGVPEEEPIDPELKYFLTLMSKFRMLMAHPAARKIQRAYRRKRRYNTRGPGRGYLVGYNRFGRVSNPELKSKVLTREGVTAANTVQEIVCWPSITQGLQDDQRIGNRLNAKFLNVKLLLMSQRPDNATLPVNPPVIRYVMWTSKDPTTPVAGIAAQMSSLTLVNFLNTKQIRVLKTGYITLSAAGTAKVKSLNLNMRNKTIDFIANTDVTANTTQNVYLHLYSNQVFNWQHQSKFYFADP